MKLAAMKEKFGGAFSLAGIAGPLLTLVAVGSPAAYASNCPTASLTTYINGTNSPCSIGADTVTFGPTLSYAGLSIGEATPPTPGQITVVPGVALEPSISFTGNFAVGPLVGSETNVFHFTVQSNNGSPLTATQLSIIDPSVTPGALGVGALAATELVCLGGTFTSLPTGVLGSLLNLGDYGCSGVTVQAGVVGEGNAALLAALGATLGTQATLTLNTDPTEIDVLKIQTLDATLTAKVSDGGLGDSFTNGPSPVPEPASFGLCGGAMLLLAAIARKKLARGER